MFFEPLAFHLLFSCCFHSFHVDSLPLYDPAAWRITSHCTSSALRQTSTFYGAPYSMQFPSRSSV
jgi:hypothetical protein